VNQSVKKKVKPKGKSKSNEMSKASSSEHSISDIWKDWAKMSDDVPHKNEILNMLQTLKDKEVPLIPVLTEKILKNEQENIIWTAILDAVSSM
jgi:hypothetical protein